MAVVQQLMRGSTYAFQHLKVLRPELQFVHQLRKQKVRSPLGCCPPPAHLVLRQAAELAALDLKLFSKKDLILEIVLACVLGPLPLCAHSSILVLLRFPDQPSLRPITRRV